MFRGMTRAGRLLSWMLAFALMVMPSAMCVLGSTIMQSQKACIAAMDQDCGAVIQQGCCPTERSNLKSLASSTPASQLASPTLAVVSLPRLEPKPPAHVGVTFEARPLTASNIPTYLFVSAFRI